MYRILSLLLISLALATAVSPPFTHHAILDNVQAKSNSTAWGAAVVSFNRVTGVLSYTLVNNVQDTFLAHIHGPGYVLTDGNIIVTIPGFENGSNWAASGSVSIPPANYDDIDQGRTYFNIHTHTFPGGEIRGQILAINQQITSLNGAQDGVTTTAIGAAWTKFDPATGNLTLILNHNVANATSAHIHGPGAPGVSAPVVVAIVNSASEAANTPYILSAVLTNDQASWLNQGLLYYNVHSLNNPNGEIRGQINPIVNYLAGLDGAQDNVSTSALGAGFAALYGTSLWTAIYHTVQNVTSAHVHTAPPGVSGPITFPYSDASVNPISQNFTATADQVAALVNGSDYFNVHTAAVPAGLIRGQIYAKQGTNTPTTSTSGGVTSTGNSTGTTTTSSTGTTATSSTSSTTSTSAAASLVASFVVLALVFVALLI